MQAVAQGDLTFAKQLIAVATVSAFTQGDANGKQPLHCACEAGHLHVAQWLLEKGAAHGVTVGAVDGKKGQPMHYACRRGHIELAQWLHSQGALPQKGVLSLHGVLQLGSHIASHWITMRFQKFGIRL